MDASSTTTIRLTKPLSSSTAATQQRCTDKCLALTITSISAGSIACRKATTQWVKSESLGWTKAAVQGPTAHRLRMRTSGAIQTVTATAILPRRKHWPSAVQTAALAPEVVALLSSYFPNLTHPAFAPEQHIPMSSTERVADRKSSGKRTATLVICPALVSGEHTQCFHLHFTFRTLHSHDGRLTHSRRLVTDPALLFTFP